MIHPSRSRARKSTDEQEEAFDLKKVFTAFAGLPRVTKIVWGASPWLTLGMAGFTIIGGLTPLGNAIIARLLLDSVIHAYMHHTFAPVWLPVILQLGINILNQICTTVISLFQPLLQERVTEYVQMQILHKTNTLDLKFFEDSEFYDKLRRATDDASYKPFSMISQTFTLVRAVVTLVSMLGLLLHLAWWLLIVAVVIPIPSFIASSRYSFRSYWQLRRQSPEKRQQSYLYRLMTTDDYNKEIKLFNLSTYFIQRYHSLAEKFYRENKSLTLKRNATNLIWSTLSVISNSSVYLYVAYQAVLGRISFGSLTQYTIAVSQVGTSVQGVLDGITNLYENNLFVDNVFEFLDYTPEIVSPAHPSRIELPENSRGLDIEFRNVSFTYPDKEKPALHNLSFTICSGETIALVGRNGAGKTTLVKLLTRLYDPDEGEILLGGRNIKEYNLQDLREQIGVIFQDYVRYALKVQENIGVGRISDVENLALVKSAAAKSGADSVVDKLDDGYETMLGKWFDHGTQLSGGEWQKVALARAFMRDARVLILDEPTSALDAQAEYDVFTRFRQLTEGKTALFISHRFSTVRLADRIFVIENSELIESGTHNELIEQDGRYAQLFNLQAEAYR
ncbi:MAG TPA: ABC transporter ATP-binding protein [Ktedonobacteraceae bacterium]|nr:ABC transporter ATP-binding protein [Ktedonobacteraceae bacterium]